MEGRCRSPCAANSVRKVCQASLADQQRVLQDNLDQMQLMVQGGGGTVRENPANSWHLPQEKRMKASGLFREPEYDACCMSGARCKRQLLKHNIDEISNRPPAKCRRVHSPQEWEPVFHQGQMWFRRKPNTPLAFAIAVSASWWAVRTGHEGGNAGWRLIPEPCANGPPRWR